MKKLQKSFIRKIFFVSTLTIFMIMPFFVLDAQVTRWDPSKSVVPQCEASTCGVVEFFQLIVNLIDIGIYLGLVFSSFLFVWAGWLYLKPDTSESAQTEAKRMAWHAVIGLLIALGGFLIVQLLVNTLGVSDDVPVSL